MIETLPFEIEKLKQDLGNLNQLKEEIN